MSAIGGGQSAEIVALPPDGSLVRLKRGMPGTFEGQTAIVHHRHPTSGHSNLTARNPLVWLECEVIWSHGTADGFWAGRGEYVVPPVHACPPEGVSGVMPCCGKTPFEVPRTDRLTSTEEVTCRG